MKKYSFNIIGAGKVGTTIGYLLNKQANFEIKAVLNRTIESAKKAIDFIGHGIAVTNYTEIPKVDITFITTPDEKIKHVLNELLSSNLIANKSFIVHCSGIFPANIVHTDLLNDFHFVKLHPIKHFSCYQSAANDFSGTDFIFEGDNISYNLIQHIAQLLNINLIRMHSDNSMLYHTSCVFASTFHQLLIIASSQLFEQCSISKEDSINLSINICKNILKDLSSNVNYKDMICGPISRKEYELVKSNRNQLINKKELNIYDALINYASTTLGLEDNIEVLNKGDDNVKNC